MNPILTRAGLQEEKRGECDFGALGLAEADGATDQEAGLERVSARVVAAVAERASGGEGGGRVPGVDEREREEQENEAHNR